MNKAYQLGQEINQVKEQVLPVLIEDLSRIKEAQTLSIDMDAFALRQYAQLAISKLFLALISNKPGIFKQFVLWEATVFSRNKTMSNRVVEHITIFRDALKRHISRDLYDILDRVFNHSLSAMESLPKTAETSCLESPEVDKERSEKYLDLVLNKKQHEAVHYIGGLTYNKIKPIKGIYSSIIVPVQREVGRLWQAGKISVADEHYATETTKNVINSLRNSYPQTETRGSVVSVTLGGEMHDIGIRVVSEYLMLSGYQVYYLGVNIPIPNIVDFIRQYPVNAVAVSITNSNYILFAETLIEVIKYKHQMNTKIMVGGLAFAEAPEAWKILGADGFGKDADSAVALMQSFTEQNEISA